MTRKLSAVLAAALLFSACSSSSGGGTNTPTVTSISLSPAAFALAIGGTQALSVSAVFSDNSTAIITTASFSSSAPAVATVSDAGLVTAVTAGTATVTATSGAATATAKVTVNAAGPALTLVAFDDNYGTGITFNPFGGSTGTPVIDTAQHEVGAASLRVDVPATGFAGGAFKVTPAVDASGFNAVTFWVMGSANKSIDKFGMGNDAADTTFQAEWLAVPITTTWTKLTLPLPLAARLTALTGAFHYAIGGQGAFSFWLDQIQYEKVTTLTGPTAALASQTLTQGVGDKVTISGLTVTYQVSGTAETLTAAPRYFTFTSSNTAVATVDQNGVITCAGNGSAVVTASLGTVPVTGSVTLTVNTASSQQPTTAPPTPTLAAANVISVLSGAYTNVAVDTYNADFSNDSGIFDFTAGADHVKEYKNLNFAGIDITTTPIDALAMTFFHIDYWTPDATVFKVKLVDFGSDGVFQGSGADSESELTFNNPAKGTWNSLDLPLTQFTGLAAKQHIAQIILSGSDSTLFIDNVYFHSGTVVAPATLSVFADDFAPGSAFAPFGGSSNDINVDPTVAHSGTSSLKVIIPATSGFTGGAIALGTPADLSPYNALTFWAMASSAKTIDKVGFANDANGNVGEAVELAPVALTTTWQKFIVPLPNPARLTAEKGLFHFATGFDTNGIIFWLDDIQYETVDASVLGTAHAAIATETLAKSPGQTFAVDGPSVTWFLNGGTTPTTVSVTPGYFTYSSSDSTIASVDATGTITAVKAGTAHITAKLLGTAAAGDIEVDITVPAAPSAAPTAPTLPSSLVISLLSKVYTNASVDTWSPSFQQGTETDVTIGGDAMKEYTGLTISGAEFLNHTIDATAMDHVHLDVWTDATSLTVSLVDVGADNSLGTADDSSGSVTFGPSSSPVLTQATFVSLDIPLASFNLAARLHLGQLKVATAPGNNTLYLDNVYFHGTASSHVLFDDDFRGVTFAAFGGSTNAISIDTTVFHSGTASLKVVIPTSNYTGGALVSSTPVDLSAYNAVTFWAIASSAKTFDTVGLGNDNTATLPLFAETHALAFTTTWTKFILPLPLPSKFTAADGLFHFATGGDGAGITIWFDDIQYESVPAAVLGNGNPAIATETLNKTVGDTFAVDGPSVAWFFNGGSTPTVVALGPAWMTYASSDATVASVDGNTAIITALKAGATTITAALGPAAAGGAITVNVAAVTQPTVAPPRPTAAANTVFSILSDAYTNVSVDDYYAAFSDGGGEVDFTVGADHTKEYKSLVFCGIETIQTKVDATGMNFFHIDVWTPNSTLFKVKLVDFGPNGNQDIEAELTFNSGSTPPLTTGQWVSYDIPLSTFQAGGLTQQAHLAQYILSASTATIYIDNVYFHQ